MTTTQMKPTRYAHSEGHVDLTFDHSGKYMFTCGSDGDLRVYKGFNDDDPVSHRVGDVVYSVAYNADKFYVSSDDNAVKVYTFPDGDADGIITRFMAPATHIVFNKSGSKLLAGSNDFTVKYVDIESHSQTVFQGHDAPVLSVALSPDEQLVASSSCDGTVRIWDIKEQKCTKIIPGLPKSNDFNASTTLSRLTWNKEGNYLIVPVAIEVRVYDTTSWQMSFILTDSCIKENVSITRFSPDWNYLVAACRDGQFVVWDFTKRQVVQRMRHPQKQPITALCWNPKVANQLAYCDGNGGLGLIENVVPDAVRHNKTASSSKPLNTDLNSDLFADVEDDMLVEATNQGADDSGNAGGPTSNNNGDDDDDDDAIDIGALKKEILCDFLDDESSKDTDVRSVSGQEGQASAVSDDVIKTKATYLEGFQPTTLQPPFQPSSCPVHFSHRFMVWNSVGIIVHYNTDEENSINVEFHDTAVHHSIHITNTLNHTMAALSHEAVLLASEADEETPSKLVCMHFASWDNNKEWSVDMPSGENIKTICLGEGWAAVGTDKRLVRLFTIGGVQKQVISIPGPIVTLAGHTNQLLIIYHAGMGIPGDQCLGVRLQTVSGLNCCSKLAGEHLPLTPKSTLSWAGFSAEGTPFIMDSHGIIRMLNRGFDYSWTQVANLKKLCKGKSDHYWLCSLHENPQQIRAILCRGSRYPPILPRPTIQVLPYQLPLCDLATDKGTLEETLWRSKLMSEHLHWWESEDFEVTQSAKSRALMSQQESLMKLFALACKTGQEFRATELCRLMANHQTVQLAIKYASRLRLMQLAERLTEVAREKVEEEMLLAQRTQNAAAADRDDDDDDDEDHVVEPRSHQAAGLTRQTDIVPKAHTKSDQEEQDLTEDEDDDVENVNVSTDIYEELEQEQEAKHKTFVLKFGANKSRELTPKSLSHSQHAAKNPFKVGSQDKTPAPVKGTRIFDSLEKPKLNSSVRSASAESKNKAVWKTKKAVLKSKQSGQQRLFEPATKKAKEINSSEKDIKSTSGSPSSLDIKSESLHEASPEGDDRTLLAEKQINSLMNGEQEEELNKKSGCSDGEADLRKRKRECVDDDVENRETFNSIAKSAKKAENDSKSGRNKLKNFVFEKQ